MFFLFYRPSRTQKKRFTFFFTPWHYFVTMATYGNLRQYFISVSISVTCFLQICQADFHQIWCISVWCVPEYPIKFSPWSANRWRYRNWFKKQIHDYLQTTCQNCMKFDGLLHHGLRQNPWNSDHNPPIGGATATA